MSPYELNGFLLSNNATSPNTQLNVGDGECESEYGGVGVGFADIIVPAMTKDLGASWSAGDGNGGLFSGSVAASTVYHVFAITKNSVNDYGFDTSVNAANRPAGYFYRRIGSVLTDSNSHIRAFHQYGDKFVLDTSVKDTDVTNPGTSAVTRTLTVPTGVQVAALVTAIVYDSAQYNAVYVSSLDEVDQTCSYPNATESAACVAAVEGVANLEVVTNTSGQIRTRLEASAATSALKIRTRGWIDSRGKK